MQSTISTRSSTPSSPSRLRPISAGDVNTLAKWQSGKFLPAPEGDNDETHLSSGPNGVFLSYRNFVPNDDHVGLRRFDDATDTFGAPTYVEGANTIDNDGVNYPYHSQDSAGRLHFVWRTLYDGMRLRYTRSDDGGATWTPASNLAVKESFFGPIVEAGPAGTGFAIWGFDAAGETTIRIVAIDPQFEADPAAVDNTPPTVGGLDAGDTSLLPGQGTTFTFNTSEAGKAVLSFQKRVKGLKVKKGGKLRCVPKTKKLVRKLRPKLRPLQGLEEDRQDHQERRRGAQQDRLQRTPRRPQARPRQVPGAAQDHRYGGQRVEHGDAALPRAEAQAARAEWRTRTR